MLTTVLYVCLRRCGVHVCAAAVCMCVQLWCACVCKCSVHVCAAELCMCVQLRCSCVCGCSVHVCAAAVCMCACAGTRFLSGVFLNFSTLYIETVFLFLKIVCFLLIL